MIQHVCSGEAQKRFHHKNIHCSLKVNILTKSPTSLLIKKLGFLFPSWGWGLQLLLEGVGNVMGRGPFLLPAGFGYVGPLGRPEHRDGCASGLVAARFGTGAKFQNLIFKREGQSCSSPHSSQLSDTGNSKWGIY